MGRETSSPGLANQRRVTSSGPPLFVSREEHACNIAILEVKWVTQNRAPDSGDVQESRRSLRLNSAGSTRCLNTLTPFMNITGMS